MRSNLHHKVAIAILVMQAGLVHAQPQSEPSDAKVRERIRYIMETSVAAGHRVLPNGISVYTRVPPSKEATDEVKKLGDRAVPALSVYALSSDVQYQNTAVFLLNGIGTAATISPLRSVLATSHSQSNRLAALEVLISNKSDEATAALREFQNDADPVIRNRVIEALLSRTGQR